MKIGRNSSISHQISREYIHLYGRDELEIEISSFDPEKTVAWLTVKECGIKLVYEDEVHIIGYQISPGGKVEKWKEALTQVANLSGWHLPKGTEAVEGLFLNFAEPSDIQVDPRAFEKMKRLWLLHLNYVNLRVGYEHISKRLLWLCWNGFPLECVPSKLHMQNLVTLDLSHSRLKQVWKGTKVQHYSSLSFNGPQIVYDVKISIARIPDFSKLNQLIQAHRLMHSGPSCPSPLFFSHSEHC
ncbi:hypothetical protein RHSIM_Rhsim08G0165300 [Rhododendron simsii]|uniref:Uncharacterized protein n=1 Tax=Rhododendron simsii TaxID=118357 RepID=A0A834GM41_RHOSS|nr:hypothetical protein RHSIM_Rhsim08G0165300 [Rhododendron simsii]